MRSRWNICEKAIEWYPQKGHSFPHEDRLEMSGKEMSLILKYGVLDDGSLKIEQRPVIPMLRCSPNNTGASFQVNFLQSELPAIAANSNEIIEYPEVFRFDGVMTVKSRTQFTGLYIIREIYISDDLPIFFNLITLENKGNVAIPVSILRNPVMKTGRGANGVFLVESRISPGYPMKLLPGMHIPFGLMVSARQSNHSLPFSDPFAELLRRRARIAELTAPLQLKTGISELDLEFHFAKLRAGESIFRTRGGLMHSPGGGTYYAATWCNDQLEYAAPWFAWTADSAAMEATLNAFRLYTRFMGPDNHSIPSSVIAEGFDIWEGRGDRGDAAMFAYGASQFALISGSKKIALELWNGIRWTLEYCHKKRNRQGVVRSDTDEMERRFPAGSANLCTSSLYYGALILSSLIAKSLGMKDVCTRYISRAEHLAESIEKYFGAEMHGFHTYRYYEGNTLLRSWIGIPLCMGLWKRAKGTVDALFSTYLRCKDGLLTQEGNPTYWDRSILYSFRGAFAAGFEKDIFSYFLDYSTNRLCGEHIPYPFESCPEKHHLSAESALFCRIITEGLLGITPLSFDSFSIKPHLPKQMDFVELNNIRAFGRSFDIYADKKEIKIQIKDKEIILSNSGGTVQLN